MRALVICAAIMAGVTARGAGSAFTWVDVQLVDCTDCIKTYRLYAHFTEPTDQLLAVNAEPGCPLEFYADAPLLNDGRALAGFKQEDFAMAPITGPRDSWVTIAHDVAAGNDTQYSPGFLGGDGVHAVITGSDWVQRENGGWFDGDPGTPALGPTVLIAQLTFPESFNMMSMSGVVSWLPAEGELQTEPFFAWYVEDKFLCPTDIDFDDDVDFQDLLILLAAWGPCDTCCAADFDANGAVGFDDLVQLLSFWGSC